MNLLQRIGLIGILWIASAAGAGAELTLSPLRQVITNADPQAEYQISNPSDRFIEGRVSWLDLRATADGYVAASEEERKERSAAPFLTVQPAQFRLEPGARTTITVRLRDIHSVPKGERRSHLLLETGAARTQLRKAGGGLELDIGLGVSTPVILRGGDADAGAKFTSTRLLRDEHGMLELETALKATGDHSAFGTLNVYLTSRSALRKGKLNNAVALAVLENVAVYPDAEERRFRLALNIETLPNAVLHVSFDGAQEYEGRIFAEKSFEIAPAK